MYISIETNALTALDKELLATLADILPVTETAPVAETAPVEATPERVTATAPQPKKAPAPKPAPKPEPVVAPEPEPEPEPVVEEDLLGGEEATPEPEGPTMADAVAAATKLVSSGGAPKVKEALAAVGAKRVSEIAPDQIAAFLAALDA